MKTNTNTEAEKLARLFHDTYERLAPQHGYETRDDTKQFDPTTPNGQLMIAVAQHIIDQYVHQKTIDPFDFVEPCEPDCSKERHAYHQGQWDMATRIEASLNTEGDTNES